MTKFLSRIPWKYVAISSGILAIIVTLILIFIPKESELTITDKSWERKVIVEEYRTVHEEGWNIPTGGRKTGEYQDIYTHQEVLDHYDYITKSREIPDGGHEEVIGYRDNGDGTFEEITRWVTDYKTEYYQEAKPVYRQDPIYQTKYRYDIERWLFDHYETTSGHTDTPYFATPTLAENFRTNGTKEKYTVTAFANRDSSKTEVYTLSFKDWQSIKIDQTIHVKIHIGNQLELIKNE